MPQPVNPAVISRIQAMINAALGAHGIALTLSLEGDEATAVTDIPLTTSGTLEFSPAGPGFPIPIDMVPESVAISWVSGGAPSGDWTLTLVKREPGGSYQDVASINITH